MPFLQVLWSALAEPAVIAAIAVVFVAGLSRGFAGFGAGLIYVPAAAALLGPEVAAATILLYDLPVAIPFTIRYLPKARTAEVLPLAVGALVATPFGFLTLAMVDPTAVRWAISIVVLSAVAMIAAGVKLPAESGRGTAVSVGMVSGFLNGLAQVGGPPVILYWLGRAVEPAEVRASALLYFLIVTFGTLLTYGLGGLFTERVLALSILMCPVFAVAMVLGSKMFGLASPAFYRRFAYGLIALSGLAGLPVWSGS